MRLVSFLLISTLSLSYSLQSVTNEDVAQLREELGVIEDRLDSLASDAKCDTDQDCKSVPVGHRACGGPKRFLIYSSQLDADQIREISELSRKTETIEKKINRLSFAVSICPMESPPILSCKASRCVS